MEIIVSMVEMLVGLVYVFFEMRRLFLLTYRRYGRLSELRRMLLLAPHLPYHLLMVMKVILEKWKL